MKSVRIILFLILCICFISCEKKQKSILESEISESLEDIESINQSEIEKNISTIINTDSLDKKEVIFSELNPDNTIEKDDSDISLLPLGEEEYFQLRYIEYNKQTSQRATNYVYKISNDISEIYYDTGTSWGTCQISKDRRKVLIKKNGNHDIYLLDGNTGMINYVGTVKAGCCGSLNLDYLITSKWYEEKIAICVMNMNTFEEEYHLFWEDQDNRICFYNILMYSEDIINNLLQKKENDTLVLDIPEGEFDCVIIGFGMEGPTAYGLALLNVNTKEFVKFNFEFET